MTQPRTRFATAMVFLVASLFTMATPADELSLDAARAAAAKGDTAILVSYAEALRYGWRWGIAMIDANQLVDPTGTYSEATHEKEPLMKHIRCIQGLTSQDLVTKALKMNPSRPDLSSKVDTFSLALALTIADLCPSPSIESKSERHPVMTAWILVLATQVQGGVGGDHVEINAQATTNGYAFPTLNSCQVRLLEWEHKMSADSIGKNAYSLKCLKVFK